MGGKHFSEWPDAVKALKRAGKLEEAERLLLALVDATEAESRNKQFGVAPWYYEQLAILYWQRKDYASELSILERYSEQKHAPGVGPKKLSERLAKVRARIQDGA